MVACQTRRQSALRTLSVLKNSWPFLIGLTRTFILKAINFIIISICILCVKYRSYYCNYSSVFNKFNFVDHERRNTWSAFCAVSVGHVTVILYVPFDLIRFINTSSQIIHRTASFVYFELLNSLKFLCFESCSLSVVFIIVYLFLCCVAF